MAKIKKNIKKALAKVNAEIEGLANRESRFAAALSSEGYAGGYRDCLYDIRLVLDGIRPDRRNYWDEWEK